MEQSKPININNLSIEELKNLAKTEISPKKDKKSSNLHPVKEFTVSEDIKPGPVFVSHAIIYERYTAWAKRNKVETILKHQVFFREFKNYFEKKISGNETGVGYMLDPAGFDMSPENVQNARKRNSLFYGKKKKT